MRRRLVVSEVEQVEGGAEGDAQIEVLGEGVVPQRVFTLQVTPRAGLTTPYHALFMQGRCWPSAPSSSSFTRQVGPV